MINRDMFDDPEMKAVARVAARNDFYFFARYMFARRKNFTWQRAQHHKVICDALTRVFRGETRRLIINIPPRYSKTELAVIDFVPWCLGKIPDCEFIHASYSATLAVKNSWSAKDLMEHEAYGEIFDTKLASDSKAKGDWKTTEGGIMYATGSGGTITGFGAGKHRPGFGGAIIIDDPHKPDEAASDVVRQGVIDWFQNTLESRCNSPETPIILIMQRLHQSDLAGWLLDGGNGEEWEHVCLPALIDEGLPTERALWPEKHTVADLKQRQLANEYVFSGQYQQTPTPKSGGQIKPDNIQIVDEVPANLNWVRGWDLAATKDAGDWTACGRVGVDANGIIWIEDVARLRGSPDEVEAMIVNTTKRDGHKTLASIPQDPAQAGKAQVAYLSKKLAGQRFEFSLESGDKATRATGLASQINVGNVRMRRAPWNSALIEEMRYFPVGKFDDQIDALSRAYTRAIRGNSIGILF